MRVTLLTAAVGVACAAAASPTLADFVLGKETKGITVKTDEEADLRLRIRLQPRLDIGDLYTTTAGKNISESDLYLRRARLEVSGRAAKDLRYNLVLRADRDNQAGAGGTTDRRTNAVVHTAWLDYKFNEAAALRFGNFKQPLSRERLISSARLLLVERPASIGDVIDGTFGDQFQTKLMLHGKPAGGFKYAVALADGSKLDQDNTTAIPAPVESDPALMGRVEFSPAGWTEKELSGSHLGVGRHMTVGLHVGQQDGLKQAGSATEVDRALRGADFSMNIESLTFQAEYNSATLSKTGVSDREPEGWYVQAGYFIPGINLEPVLRYERHNRDANAPTDREDEHITLGFNWYWKGHSAKLGVNWVNTELGKGNVAAGGDSERDVLQVQAQLYF